MNKQSDEDYAWEVAKSFYNGSVNQLARGIMGSLEMIRENNIESLKARGLEYNESEWGSLEYWRNRDSYKPYEVKSDT